MKPKSKNRFFSGYQFGINLAGIGCVMLAGSLAQAGNLYWDTNANQAGSGNSGGNWSGFNWSTDVAGTTIPGAWVDGESAVFSAGTDGTGGWTVTLGVTVSTPSITFAQTGSKTISGGIINIGGGTINATAVGQGGGDDINMNTTLAGAGGLTIAANGDGTTPNGGGGGAEFRLGGTNTFTGGLRITKGAVTWSSPASLGDPSNVITLDGGALLVQGSQSTSRDIKIGPAGGYYRGYGGTSFIASGTISNGTGVTSANLTRTDGGIMYLAGPGTSFIGTLIAAGGDFNLYSPNANWQGAAVTLTNGRLIAGSGGTAKVKSLKTTKDVIVDNGTTLDVVTGTINLDNGGHWYKTENGSLGKLTSSSGTLNITDGATTGDMTNNDHRVLVSLTNSGATPVAVVKNNNNSVTFGVPNTYTGGTTINGGRILTEDSRAFGTGNVTIASGAVALLNAAGDYPNNFTINGNGPNEGANNFGALRFGRGGNITGNVTLGSASRILTLDANRVGTISGSLIGSAALSKTGAGTVAINGNATGYTGTLTVEAGTLRLGSALGNAGLGSVVVNDLARLSGKGTIANSLTLGTVDGANFSFNGQTAGALGTKDLIVNGLNTVKLTGTPTTSGAVPIITYSGTLTMTGAVTDHFQLENAESYRTAPVFANSAGAITLEVPTGATLVWSGEDPGNPTWFDTTVTKNWKNGETADVFYAGDNVLFDDTASNLTVELQGLVAPASVTFNNSLGFDYIFPLGPGAGFTGGTGIVKNGTGTVSLGGYSHNYTGAVTINDGVLRASGNNELLGNSSGITVKDSANGGGQLDMNGQNLGDLGRTYNITIAGDGPDGLGAITNSGGGSPNENSGLQFMTLSANAAIGGTGGRYDIALGGGITGGGFTLSKVGSNYVNLRGPATGITYVIEEGMLGFENTAVAAGTNPITVNGGRVGAYGILTFANTLNLASGTSLVSNGGGSQTWNGPVNLTGSPGETVKLEPNGNIILDTVVSGDPGLEVSAGGGQVIMTGAASNTYAGSTSISTNGQVILSKTGGAIAIPSDFNLFNPGVRAVVSATQDNQFGPTSVMFWSSAGDGRFELKGTTQTLAGIDNTGATGGANTNFIQHSEFGAKLPVDEVSDLILNVQEGDFYTFNGTLRDQGGKVNLTKTGPGTQSLKGSLIDYSGPTTINGGRLILDSDDLHSASVTVAAGAVYELNITDANNRLEQDATGFTLSGAGTFEKTGPGRVSMGWQNGAIVAMASGALIDVLEGTLQLENGSQTVWTTNKSDLTIGASGVFDLWDNNNGGVFVDSLNGEGSIIRTQNAVGVLTIGVDNGNGDFSGSISSATGTTNLVKQGTGSQRFQGAVSHRGNTTISGGTVEFTDTSDLTFFLTDGGVSNQVNGAGNLILNGMFVIDTSGLTATSGSWTLIKRSELASVVYGANFTPGTGWTKAGVVWTGTDGGKTYTFNETTGVLTLTSDNSYATWIDGFFPGETDLAIVGANADPDNDGIPNGVELVIGGNPATEMNTALLPTLELVTDPAGLPTGNYLLFTFRRTDLSTASGVTSVGEYDADLVGPWTTAQDGVSGVSVVVDDNYGAFVPPATADTDRVRVFIPRGTNSKLFGRLKVTVP